MAKKKYRGSKPAAEQPNLNPYKDWPRGQVTNLKGIEVYVADQNAGMTWFSPTRNEEEWSKDNHNRFLLQGLMVLQVNTDGSVRDCYRWDNSV